MIIEFIKTKVDHLFTDNSFSTPWWPIRNDESQDNNPMQGLKQAIERHGSSQSPQRSQTTVKQYKRAKSDSIFKLQNTLQAIFHQSSPSKPTLPDGSMTPSKISNRSNPANFIKKRNWANTNIENHQWNMLFIFVKVVDTNIKPLAYKRRNSVTPNQVMNTFMEQMKNYLKEMCVIVKFI